VLSGARTVVSSLWQVDDASTAALMDRFYGALARGATAGTALREARRELAHAPATSQPYYWAAFVLTGDGRTLLPLRGPTARRGT
jgi:CHAT domain-containing protein